MTVSTSEYISNEEDKKNVSRLHTSNTMQKYDKLLERIRTTDEQLQSLSKLWSNNTQRKTPITNNKYSSYQDILNNYKKEFESINFKLKMFQDQIRH